MSDKILRIAVVGHPLSGKDVVAKYLEEKHNFYHVSSGDLIRKYIRDNNLGEPVRELMHHTANHIRQYGEPGILPKMAIKEQGDRPRLVLSGTRAKSDIDTFIDLGGIVIAVNCSIEDRYKRALERGRIGDHISFEQFKFEEDREATATEPYAQNVCYVVSRANYHIENDSDLQTLYHRTDEVLQRLGVASVQV